MVSGASQASGRALLVTMRLTPKRVMALVGGLVAIGSFARVAVLFLESLAAVRDERYQDTELLELCRTGVARESLKMRSACLQAQADKASPIVLKAVLRAFSTAFEDFSDSVSSPGKMLVVVLFALTSVFIPVTTWIKAILPPEETEDGSQHVVVLANTGFGDAVVQSPRQRFRRAVGALRFRRGPKCIRGGRTSPTGHVEMPVDDASLLEIGGDDAAPGMVEVDLSALANNGRAKWD